MSSLGDPGQRRARLAGRHLLDGSARSPEEAARAVGVLHATDPATVYLSILARGAGLALDDIAAALYERRTLVRMMAMRRTLFAVPTELAPVVHTAASTGVAATMRKTLVKQLATLPTDPPVEDPDGWLAEVGSAVEAALQRMGSASGAQLGAAVPRLRTAFLPTTDKAYDVRRTVTTQALAVLGAQGRIVRGQPLGAWTSRHHAWEPAQRWWPDGLPDLDPAQARADLVTRYLERFGPASEADVAWWTGWPLGMTRSALRDAGATSYDGLVVAPGDDALVDPPPPAAALLPALDPTPMGWKQREWYLPADPRPLFDANGNIGPTVWWGGEVVGGWAIRKDGTMGTELLVDRGRECALAVAAAAERWGARLSGAVVVPSFRTPLERKLSGA